MSPWHSKMATGQDFVKNAVNVIVNVFLDHQLLTEPPATGPPAPGSPAPGPPAHGPPALKWHQWGPAQQERD